VENEAKNKVNSNLYVELALSVFNFFESCRKFALGYHYEGDDWDTILRVYVTTRNMDQLKYYFRKHFNQ
jgi:hypothetical protein